MIKEPIKPDYQQTPVGIIPKEWEVKKISELGKVVTGSTPKTSVKEYYDGNGLFVSPVDIQGNSYVNQTEKTLTALGLEQGRQVPKNSVLFVSIGSTIGKVSISGRKLITNQQINSIVPNDQNHFYFLFNQLRQRSARIKLLAANQAVPILNKSAFSNIQLPIPPLPEQKSIADCLSTWDAGIEKLTQLIQAKKQQKKGLMQQLFNGELSMMNGQLKRVENEEERLKGWKEVRLGDYFKERNERGFDNLELLSIGENGVYPQSMSNKKDTSNADKSKYKLIEKGDIGYNTMRLWQGRLALSSLRGIVSPAYTIVIPEDDKTNSKFFSYFFKMSFVVFKFYRNSQGMVSDTLQCRYKDFKKIKVKIPSLKEQTAIAEILQTADQEIELLEQKLSSFQQQKKGLMQVLLTGEKRLV